MIHRRVGPDVRRKIRHHRRRRFGRQIRRQSVRRQSHFEKGTVCGSHHSCHHQNCPVCPGLYHAVCDQNP